MNKQKIKKFRVYQNITTYSADVMAENKVDAISKAQNVKEWEEYDLIEQDISYEAVEIRQ